MKYLLILFLFTLCFSACKKDKSSIDRLPPITQEGKNTFGCLINGKLYVPKGFKQNQSNFSMVIDPTFQNGHFSINTFNTLLKEELIIASNDIGAIGIYRVEERSNNVFVDYINSETNCSYSPSTMCLINGPCYIDGFIQISKYDLINGLFSGTFEFKIYDPNTSCDTIFVTEGRFDKKL